MSYVGDVAANYERDRTGEPLWQTEQLWVSSLVQTWPRGSSVLDVPVGTGRFLPIYQQFGMEATGIDTSADMLAAARAKGTEARLFLGDAGKIDLPAKSVDYSVCWRLTHLVPPDALNAIVAELARVTRRRVVIQFFSLGHPGVLRKTFGPLLARLRGSPGADFINYSHTEADLTRAIERAGAKVNRVEHLPDRRYSVAVYVVACAP
jgi:ubiquinone/menaquinone biosynthesis C-methylase UbiE